MRLNCKKTYDAKRTFVAVANIEHADMIFTDGTPPPNPILKSFLRLCEQYIDDGRLVNERPINEIVEPNAIGTNKSTNKSTNSEGGVTECSGVVAVHCKGKIFYYRL